MLAARKGALEAVQILIAKGAELNTVNGPGISALTACVVSRSEECLDALLAAGADLNSPPNLLHQFSSAGWAKGLKKVIEKGGDVNVRNDEGNTPLHIAAGEEQTACIAVLKGLGADITATNQQGQTPAGVAEAAGLADLAAVINGETLAKRPSQKEIAASTWVYDGPWVPVDDGNGDVYYWNQVRPPRNALGHR